MELGLRLRLGKVTGKKLYSAKDGWSKEKVDYAKVCYNRAGNGKLITVAEMWIKV